MSEAESLSLPEKAYRTVTPGSHTRPNMEMDTIGWAMFLAIVVLMVPLLPFIFIVYVISKGFEYLAGRRTTEE